MNAPALGLCFCGTVLAVAAAAVAALPPLGQGPKMRPVGESTDVLSGAPYVIARLP
jgi:hypothetical protein